LSSIREVIGNLETGFLENALDEGDEEASEDSEDSGNEKEEDNNDNDPQE